jgi:hypothetical protein
MIWAFRVGGLAVADPISKHQERDNTWGIVINKDGTIVSMNDTTGFNFYEFHGFMMWAAWGVFGFIQLLSNRYLKGKWRWNMWLHRISGTCILLLTFTVGLMALARSEWQVSAGFHEILGVIILALVTLPVLGGVFNRSRMMRLRWRTDLMLKVKRGHQVSL